MNKLEIETAISTLETLVQVFGVIVAVGIVGEVGFGLRLWILNRRHSEMQHAEDFARQAEIARLNKEAGEARKNAANAELRARELEVLIQPRYLTKEQQEEIANDMRRFSGSGMVITSHWIDAESARLARQIKSALNQAGVGVDQTHLSSATVDRIGAYPEILGAVMGGGGGFSGPNIHTGIEIWGSNHDAVNVLANSLASKGKLTAVTTPPHSEYPFKDLRGGDSYGAISLVIFVGSKPIN